MNKKTLLVIGMLLLMVIPFVSAGVDYIEDNDTYIIDTWIPNWLGGNGESIVKKIENTDSCLVNCKSVIEFNNQQPVSLVEEIKFIDRRGEDASNFVEDLKFRVGRHVDVEYDKPIEEEFCEDFYENETNITENICHNRFVFEEVCYNTEQLNNETQQNETIEQCYNKQVYEKATKQELQYTDYDGKETDGIAFLEITAKKKPNKDIDWIITFRGEELIRWSWWDSNWAYKRQINLTANAGEFSYLELINYSSGMQSDFDDLRFINSAENTEFNYTIENKTDGVGARVRIFSQGETSFYIYYGNPSATTTSSASDTHFNPVSMYYLDETSGSVLDAVGSNDGTNNGSTAGVAGKIGTAYDFDGVNDYISSSLSTSLSYYSFGGWFKFTTTPYRDILMIAGETTDAFDFILATATGGNLIADTRIDGTHYSQANSGIVPTTNTWYHIIGVYDGSMNIYINGVKYTTTSGDNTNGANGDNGLIIGKGNNPYSWGASYFQGLSDEVGIWNRALSSTEITALYTQTAPTHTIGAEQQNMGVLLNLLSPENNEKLTNSNVNFSYNISVIGSEFANTTLSIWDINDTLILTNFTNLTGNLSQTINWVNNLSDGEYKWGSEICSLDAGCSISNNRTLFIDTTPPQITITAPTGIINNITIGNNETLNSTITEVNDLEECWFEYNDTEILLNNSYNNNERIWYFENNYSNVTNVNIYYGTTFLSLKNIPEICSRQQNFIFRKITNIIGTSVYSSFQCSDKTNTFFEIESISGFTELDSVNITAMVKRPLNCSNPNTEFEYVLGNNGLCVHAIDNFGLHNEDITTWNYNFVEVSSNHSNSTIEGATEYFEFNFLKVGGLQVSKTELIYENETISMTTTTTGNNVKSSINYIIPNKNNATNITFYYKVTFSDSSVYYSSNYVQEVNIINIDSCDSYNNNIYNFFIVDEETEQNFTGVDGENSVIDLEITLNAYGTTSQVLSFSGNYTNINPVQICLNQNLSNIKYSSDVIVRYLGDSHAIEYYNIQATTIEKTSTPKNITLYDLFSTDSTEFQVSFRDDNGLFVEDAVVLFNRKYVAQATYKVVEAPKTDSSGLTIAHLDAKDVIYNIVVSKYGVVLATFNNIIPFCEDSITGRCLINLIQSEADTSLYNYDTDFSISYNANYNQTTKQVQFDFVTKDLTEKNVTLKIEKTDLLGDKDIVEQSLSASSGTIAFTLPESVGNTTFYAKAYVDDELMETFIIDGTDKNPYGSYGFFVVFILMISLVLMMSSSKTMIVVGSMFGFVGAGWLSLISYSNDGIGGIIGGIAFLIVSGGILIHKLNRGVGSN